MKSSLLRFFRVLVVLITTGAGVPALSMAQTSVGDLFQLYSKSLVIVEGKDGRGSGAVLTIKGVNYIVTNAHVVAQNGVSFVGSTGKKIPVNTASFAKAHDIARYTTEQKLPALPVMTRIEQSVKIGDEIVIFGNSEGAGVFAPLAGKITGIGPRLIEFDAAIVPGNSGSPIIHVSSGKVIGVASHVIDRSARSLIDTGSQLPSVRKFGQRIDSVEGWDERTEEEYQAERKGMLIVQRRTQDLITIYNSLLKGPPEESLASRLASPLNTLIVNFARTLKQTEARNDVQGYLSALDRYFSQLERTTHDDILAVEKDSLVGYHQEMLAGEIEIRRELWKRYAGALDRLRTARRR
jgi:Trypsin-like peptidase domain